MPGDAKGYGTEAKLAEILKNAVSALDEERKAEGSDHKKIAIDEQKLLVFLNVEKRLDKAQANTEEHNSAKEAKIKAILDMLDAKDFYAYWLSSFPIHYIAHALQDKTLGLAEKIADKNETREGVLLKRAQRLGLAARHKQMIEAHIISPVAEALQCLSAGEGVEYPIRIPEDKDIKIDETQLAMSFVPQLPSAGHGANDLYGTSKPQDPKIYSTPTTPATTAPEKVVTQIPGEVLPEKKVALPSASIFSKMGQWLAHAWRSFLSLFLSGEKKFHPKSGGVGGGHTSPNQPVKSTIPAKITSRTQGVSLSFPILEGAARNSQIATTYLNNNIPLCCPKKFSLTKSNVGSCRVTVKDDNFNMTYVGAHYLDHVVHEEMKKSAAKDPNHLKRLMIYYLVGMIEPGYVRDIFGSGGDSFYKCESRGEDGLVRFIPTIPLGAFNLTPTGRAKKNFASYDVVRSGLENMLLSGDLSCENSEEKGFFKAFHGGTITSEQKKIALEFIKELKEVKPGQKSNANLDFLFQTHGGSPKFTEGEREHNSKGFNARREAIINLEQAIEKGHGSSIDIA